MKRLLDVVGGGRIIRDEVRQMVTQRVRWIAERVEVRGNLQQTGSVVDELAHWGTGDGGNGGRYSGCYRGAGGRDPSCEPGRTGANGVYHARGEGARPAGRRAGGRETRAAISSDAVELALGSRPVTLYNRTGQPVLPLAEGRV